MSDQRVLPDIKPTLSLYIHIPFCERKCPYCDFNTYAGRDAQYDAYVEALCTDILRSGIDGGEVELGSIFLGGGTPTVLDGIHLQEILAATRARFHPPETIEVTCEANPGTVDVERFEALCQLGVNRLSLGAQSFNDNELRFLGRIHTVDDTKRAMTLARRAGFGNVSLDLMFGLPHQRVRDWRSSLQQAIDLNPQHLSLYSLTVEAGTPLSTWVAQGRIPQPDPDLAADFYDIAVEELAAAGYLQYEISNWALGPIIRDGFPKYACHHNITYWRNRSYLGFGPGAHSSYHHRRWSVMSSVEKYLTAVAENASTVDFEELITSDLEMAETMILGLRLTEVGVDRRDFKQRFGMDIMQAYGPNLRQLVQRHLIEIYDERVRLTPAARLIANEVFITFLPD